MCKLNYLFFLYLFLLTCNANHEIAKRSLLFPRATVLQFTYGLTVPLVLPRRSINLSLCAQANYNLPNNITTFTRPMTVMARKKEENFDISRETFYKLLIEFLDSFGMDGEQCLLRSICEIAENPLHIQEDALLEKLVHFIFTPSLEINFSKNNISEKTLNFEQKLLMAEKNGNEMESCENVYSDCIFSFVELFTQKYIL